MRATGRFFAAIVVVSAAAGCRRDPSQAPAPAAKAAIAGGVVQKAELTRRGDHAEVALTCAVKNPGSAALIIQSPAVRLLAAGEREVPPLIAPLLAPPVIAPGVEATVTLHFWLAPADLSGPLELEIGGQRIPVTL